MPGLSQGCDRLPRRSGLFTVQRCSSLGRYLGRRGIFSRSAAAPHPNSWFLGDAELNGGGKPNHTVRSVRRKA